MQRTPLNSSMLAYVGYDGERRTLELGFSSGGIYAYLRVESEIHEGLRRAPSAGRYFNERIRDRYEFERTQ